MPTKAEMYAQMADKVATQLVGSWQEWTAFLTTAARLYKYPFHEQMMIYAQRPDATACAEYDLWNEKMGRYFKFIKGKANHKNNSNPDDYDYEDGEELRDEEETELEDEESGELDADRGGGEESEDETP